METMQLSLIIVSMPHNNDGRVAAFLFVCVSFFFSVPSTYLSIVFISICYMFCFSVYFIILKILLLILFYFSVKLFHFVAK